MGTWKVSKICGDFTEPVDADPACADSTMSFDLSNSEVTLVAKADKTYALTLTGTITGSVVISEPCAGVLAAGMAFDQFCDLAGSQMPGSPTCTIQNAMCTCSPSFPASEDNESGTYVVSGSKITTTASTGEVGVVNFCVTDCAATWQFDDMPGMYSISLK